MKFLSIVVMFFAVLIGLTGCNSDEVANKIAASDQAAANAKIAEAKAQTELRVYKEAEAKKIRLAESVNATQKIARATVRDSQLTDASGCRIIPVTLSKSEFHAEFGPAMVGQYPAACKKEVLAYRTERKQAAAKAVAMASAKARYAAAKDKKRPG